MSCGHVRSLFSDHVDGQLRLEDEELLGVHVAECPACRGALARYESGLYAVAGASPDPPVSLQARTLAAARRDGLVDGRRQRLVERNRWLLPMAASLVVFAVGYAAGRRGDPGARAAPFGELPAACALDPVPQLDLEGLRLARPAPQERDVAAGEGRIRVPGRLSSRGPYYTRAARLLDAGAGTCLPLNAAYGDALVLVIVPARGEPAGGFVVEPDSRRVLYTRVRWTQGGMAFQLEGRAESHELLALAEEIAARTRLDAG